MRRGLLCYLLGEEQIEVSTSPRTGLDSNSKRLYFLRKVPDYGSHLINQAELTLWRSPIDDDVARLFERLHTFTAAVRLSFSYLVRA